MVRGDTVYLDIIFAINFVMDYLILWTTAKFAHVKSTAFKLTAAAAAGAGLSLVLFFILYLQPAVMGTGNLFMLKLLISVIMVMIAFPFRNVRKFVTLMFNLYLTAFAMGGAMLGSIYMFNTSPAAYSTMNGLLVFLVNVRYTWLFAAIAAAVLVGRWGRGYLRRNMLDAMLKVPVVVRFGEHRLAFNALVDTGNNLRDPLTQRPVMVAEYDALKKILPKEFQVAFESAPDNLEAVVKGLEKDANWGFRIRLIPFSSIGRKKGMLLGLRPDDVVVVSDERYIRVTNVVVAIYQNRLSTKGDYRALLHPDILEAA